MVRLTDMLLLMASSPQGSQSSALVQLVPFVLMAFIFYFLLFAPERRRRKQVKVMLESLKHGDKVLTSGGIFGKVVGVTDKIVQLRIADGVKIEVNKSAVTSKVSD
ncbi:MAG: preprotein translocase subunit YajC [Acidobacteriota bacterium]